MAWHYGPANGQRSLFCITFLDGTVRLSKLLRLLNPSCDLWTLYKIFMGTYKQALYGNIRRSRACCLLYGKYFSFFKLFPFKPSTQTALTTQKTERNQKSVSSLFQQWSERASETWIKISILFSMSSFRVMTSNFIKQIYLRWAQHEFRWNWLGMGPRPTCTDWWNFQILCSRM